MKLVIDIAPEYFNAYRAALKEYSRMGDRDFDGHYIDDVLECARDIADVVLKEANKHDRVARTSSTG